MNKDRRFSVREVRALLWLLPVLAVVSWLVWEVSKPAIPGDTAVEAPDGKDSPALVADELDVSLAESEAYAANSTTNATQQTQFVPSTLFPFDPNTIEYHDLVRLGFTRGEALGIVKYRERGKVFEIPEDFAACYQVSEEMYLRLKSYIRIGEKYRLQPFERTGGAAASRDEAELERAMEEGVRRGGTGSDDASRAGAMDRPVRPMLVELNSADSAALVSVSGIGAVTVRGIMEYRARLGGFVRVEQLAEVRGVTEQNYERILTQIFVDDSVIQKIDINFADAKILAAHPYVRAETLRKLLKHRQLKGGWRTAGELEKDDIFTAEELTRLTPYLLFNPINN